MTIIINDVVHALLAVLIILQILLILYLFYINHANRKERKEMTAMQLKLEQEIDDTIKTIKEETQKHIEELSRLNEEGVECEQNTNQEQTAGDNILGEGQAEGK